MGFASIDWAYAAIAGIIQVSPQSLEKGKE
jgi:hypothetical protein